jgi:hypothetical protein
LQAWQATRSLEKQAQEDGTKQLHVSD